MFNRKTINFSNFKNPRKNNLLKKCSKEKKDRCKKKYKKDKKDLTPVRINSDKRFKLFHKRDRSSLVSKVNFFTKFILPFNIKNIRHSVLLKLFIYGVRNNLRRFFFKQRRFHNKFRIEENIK